MTSQRLFAVLARLAGAVLLLEGLQALLSLLAFEEMTNVWIVLIVMVPGVFLLLGGGVLARWLPWPDEEPSTAEASPGVGEWMRLVERAVGLFAVVSAIPGAARFIERPERNVGIGVGLALLVGGVLLFRSTRPVAAA